MTAPSPDEHAEGLLSGSPDPLRYDGHTLDPAEAAGMIAALVPRDSTVLDVGCGTGSVSKILVETRGARLTGIEPDAKRVAVARGRGINVLEGLFSEPVLGKLEKFDVVIFADVLEHLPDPGAALQLAHRVLKPDGAVVASVPNIAHWSIRLNLLRGRFDYESCGIMDATHLRWFTERSICALIESAGYRVEKVSQTAGTALPVYAERFFWRHFRPRRLRNPLIRLLTRRMPRLFGCQHVLRARRRPEPGKAPSPP